MARTPSVMTPLGEKASGFTLPDTVSGKEISLEAAKGVTATVLMFICNHCPFVKHVNPALVKLGNDYKDKGISFIAISSNDVASYPEDGPEQMKQVAEQQQYPFPYLYDETQAVAKAYEAACTPDFFIYNKDLLLAYRGQLDDSRPGNDKPVSGADIRNALDHLIAGKQVPADQKPSIGCNIKWK
ncbi:alkyl hydroperoxide reductase [Niastella koreensis]|uniref:Alkyl hydroperoxide reductase/ Thiol specific antioxidant/ Mal allergen n=2 Tax=Niastella koreensis TaxID=354356 RepID=G8TH02_NIAKG|nr:thioredoxin family protein [Niastella koreensis]AEW00613.1 alkyl hydroperoxide reductase/ Thiol specific antioxidant/ Mal allergen [Niastella koreensis GR20-10]OQP42251.1 alkyl hydroperoxide reductase [Niastella koreensis]